MTKPRLTPSFSGVDARNWRRQLAATARRADDTIRTLKFPLEIHNAHQYWPAASALHRTVASDEQGSLIRFLYTVHLNGFRVFGKQAETEAFRNAVTLDDSGWLTTHANTPLTVARAPFIPSSIYQRLLIAPRAVGGKDSGFKAETIAVEYSKFFCAGKHSENIPAPERELFDAIGAAFATEFASWKDLTSRPADGARVIDTVLKELGYPAATPSLAHRMASLRPCEPAGTVAFDSHAAIDSDNQGIEPHMIVARALFVARSEGLSTKPELTKATQIYWTGDANHGGLAWLFGKGMSYFRETSPSDAAKDFDIPPEQVQNVEAVISAAKAIPDAAASLLGGKSYSPYRSAIGGTLGSWIANYITRLFDLEAALLADVEPFELPAAILQDQKMLDDVGVAPSEIAAMVTDAMSGRNEALNALNRLTGKERGATRSEIETIESYSLLLDTLAGLLSALSERIKRSLEFAEREGDKIAQDTLSQYTFSTPKWIRRLEALNRLDLSIVDPQAELNTASHEFGLLHNAMHTHYADLLKWGSETGQTLSPLARIEALEDQYLRDKPASTKRKAPTEQAARSSFDMLGRAGRECSEITMRRFAEVLRPVFADTTDYHRYFHNRQGRLYKSNFDTNPRQPFAIAADAVKNASAVMNSVADWIADFRIEVMAETPLSLRHLTDLYHLERALFAWRMQGMPNAVPSHLAMPANLVEVFNLPIPLKLRLQAKEVSSSVMRKIFNNYYVRLKSLAAILLRDKFFLRCKFQRAGDNGILYVPGNEPWHAPDRLFASSKPIGFAARAIEKAQDGKREVSPLVATNILIGDSGVNEASVRTWLRQSPHDWYFPWQGQPSVVALPTDKSGLAKKTTTTEAARLIGAPAYKGVLDTRLADPAKVETGDVAIIFDQTFSQTCSKGDNGQLIVGCELADALVALAIPVKEFKAETTPPSFKNYIGIDLGERGIGYAVFDATTDALIEKGRVGIRSMHRLVQDDKIGKRAVSELQKFRSKFDRAEERRRENVIGDFCNAINRLMWYYDAFPVLEYSAGGASKAVDKVYEGVTNRYLFSTTSTVDAERTAYWCGASFWKHPTRFQYKFDKTTGKKGKTPEPLSLFPGVGTSAYGTSQRCSCCKRNPIDDIRKAMKDGEKTFRILDGGIVMLPSGKIQLFFAAPETERAGYRRRNERTPLTKPADAMLIKGDDLLKAAYRNLRQAPLRRQVRDTTISQYHCLYSDCGQVLHAEENAAINIGEGFAANAPKVE